MSSSMNIREAREDELDELISKAEELLPHTLTIQGILSIGFRRNIYNRNNSKIYVPVDDKLPFFIIITNVIIKNRNNMTAHWNPEEISIDVARELLLSVPGWSWEEPLIMYSTWIPTLLEIEKIVLGENGASKNKLKMWTNYGYSYTLDKNIFSHNIPESDFLLAPLKGKDADLVYKNWVYFYAEDTESIRKNLECMPSIAAYAKVPSSDPEINDNIEEHEDNKDSNKENITYKPVSWALTRPYGEIGFNFTFPEYRNKGLSGMVTRELAKSLVEDGVTTPFVNVCGHNPAAVKAIENIGFRKHTPCGYQIYFHHGTELRDF